MLSEMSRALCSLEQILGTTERDGKGLNGSATLDSGQEEMKAAASVYTEVGSRA